MRGFRAVEASGWTLGAVLISASAAGADGATSEGKTSAAESGSASTEGKVEPPEAASDEAGSRGSAEGGAGSSERLDVDAVDGNLIVSKPYGGEGRVSLTYTIGSSAPQIIEGTRSGDSWRFLIGSLPASEATLRLDFKSYRDVKEAHMQLERIGRQLYELILSSVNDAFETAARNQERLSEETWMARAVEAASNRLEEFFEGHPLVEYEIGGRPALDYVLDRLGFQRDDTGAWGFDDRSLGLLRELAKHDVALRVNAAVLQDISEDHACLRAYPSLATDQLQRVAAVHACFQVYQQELQRLRSDASIFSPAEAASLNQEVNDFSQKLSSARDTWQALADLEGGNRGGYTYFTHQAAALFQSVDGSLRIARKQAKGESAIQHIKASWDQLNEVREAIRYPIALEAKSFLESKRDAAVQSWADRLLDKNVFQAVEIDSWIGTSSELYQVDPGKPRFFFSTGVAATLLNDDVKLSVPVIASICLSPYGCETKGLGRGGSFFNYWSIDLGVKAFFIGEEDPREGTPSFLVGLGFTPVYATHLSVGANIFENPQTDRANAALYFALTLDLVDGKDILGGLGIGKPEVEQVKGKESQ